MTMEERIKRLQARREADYWTTGNRFKVGDLVRFKDISTGSSSGDGSFQHIDGKVGVIVGLDTNLSGNQVATFMYSRGKLEFKDTFNVRYFEVISGRE